MKRASLIAALALGFTSAHAELSFKDKRFAYAAKATEETVTATFEFKNTGKLPIAIQKVDSNCGCLRAEADKDRYAKGESGTITAEFKIGSAEGKQTKQVWVVYGEEKPVVQAKVIGETATPNKAPQDKVVSTTTERLTVELTVPTLVSIEPKITKWVIGSKPEPKEIRVVMDHDKPVHIKDVRSSRENVTVETKEIEAGKEYVLVLTPKSTEKVQLGMLTIQTDCEIAKHQKKLGFFSISRPERKPLPKPAIANSEGTPPNATSSETTAPSNELPAAEGAPSTPPAESPPQS